MKILAIDTSSNVCSVAILEDSKLIFKEETKNELTHSEKLLPMIDNVFKKTNLTLDDIGLLACSIGPGSFTGIRIGVSTIKAFCDVKKIPVIGVNSLEGLAYNIKKSGLICAMIDAKHDNVYCALFDLNDGKYSTIIKPDLLNINELIEKLKSYNNITFVGDGYLAHKNEIVYNSNIDDFTDDEYHDADSLSIGKCAFDKYKCGLAGDSNSLIPLYLRKSQAELALETKNKDIK